MKQLAPDVWQLKGAIPNAVNVYLIGDVLIDAGGKPDTRIILKELRGRTLSAHALTHAHADHQGASHAVCEKFGVPFWVGEDDADVAERPELIKQRQPQKPINKLMFAMFAGPGHKVDRTLREGDEVAGFQVLDTPGHSAGHVVFWRESDRVLIAGDVVNTWHPFFLKPGLREPPPYFTPDPARNRESIKRIADLEPSLLCVGHGPPSRDPSKLRKLADSLPA